MFAYFILFQTEFSERRNRLRCCELRRRIVNDRSEDMKRISQNLGRITDFEYIDILTSKFN